ncbi:hypothetical protein, partial [Methanohalobium sp.]|uniref:hypothetical protein n=1 Tax=Methanohalobium sp. TaxID=2837493 RepID=UPI0025D40B2F
SLTPTASTVYEYECQLPTGSTGLLFYIRSKSKVDRSDYPEGTGLNFKNIFIRHDWVDNFEEYGKRNHFIEPRVLIADDKLYLKVDSFTLDVTSLKLTYIRRPQPIAELGSTDEIDLPDNMHDDMIQIAVRKSIAPSSLSEQRYNIQSNEEQQTSL